MTELGEPETFLIAYEDCGSRFAVAVKGRDMATARNAFAGMSRIERRARIVGRLSERDVDHVAGVFAWLSALFPARRQPA